MPIYEYQCQQCGAHFETMQKMSDAPLTECQACGGVLEKQWSQTSFQLKGGGWYVSDYGKGGEKAKPANDKAAQDKGETSAPTDKGDAATSETPKTETAKPETPAPAAPKAD